MYVRTSSFMSKLNGLKGSPSLIYLRKDGVVAAPTRLPNGIYYF